MKKTSFKIFVIFILLFSAVPVWAQEECEVSCPPDTICIPNPLRWCTLDDFIFAIITFIFWIATAIAPLLIIIAGFYFITSAGNPSQVQTAKRIILYTLVGYAIILLSNGLVSVIKEILRVR